MNKKLLVLLPLILPFTFSCKGNQITETGGLTFLCKADNSSISYVNYSNNNPMIEYSKDGKNFQVLKEKEKINVNNNEKVFFRGDNLGGFSYSVNQYTSFSLEGSFNLYGNLMSIIDYGSLATEEIPSSYCFHRLFKGCSSLIDASELTLPVNKLTEYCYDEMFEGCTNLVEGPEVPAKTLKKGCYRSMYKGCSSLIYAPTLPAEELEWQCYNHLFDSCSKLTYLKVYFKSFKTDDEKKSEEWDSTFCWVDKFYAQGTFVCPKALADKGYSKDQSNVPFDWDVKTF